MWLWWKERIGRRYVTSQSLFALDLYVHDDLTSSLFAFLLTATFVALTIRASILTFRRRKVVRSSLFPIVNTRTHNGAAHISRGDEDTHDRAEEIDEAPSGNGGVWVITESTVYRSQEHQGTPSKKSIPRYRRSCVDLGDESLELSTSPARRSSSFDAHSCCNVIVESDDRRSLALHMWRGRCGSASTSLLELKPRSSEVFNSCSNLYRFSFADSDAWSAKRRKLAVPFWFKDRLGLL
ncbi:hypothetical protein EV421DRAFT_1740202 [Armillaria borealis]|uniref:Uncharacterized protein n=1 Tax=Armillaria borealis TaxID=47425 RepID=A0AA39J5D9_9AGAR|nr:hypothetical protein EV421DRAFT_1740202 [Armillaria borealis]